MGVLRPGDFHEMILRGDPREVGAYLKRVYGEPLNDSEKLVLAKTVYLLQNNDYGRVRNFEGAKDLVEENMGPYTPLISVTRMVCKILDISLKGENYQTRNMAIMLQRGFFEMESRGLEAGF